MFVDAILDMPTKPGAYWFFREGADQFEVCEVVGKDGSCIAKFTDGSVQRMIGKRSYFVGPIPKPVIGQGGVVSLC